MNKYYRWSLHYFPYLLLGSIFLGVYFITVRSICLLILTLVFGRKASRIYFDRNAFWIFLSCFVYYSISGIGSQTKSEVSLLLLVMPTAAYVGGKWAGYKTKGSVVLSSGLLFVGLALATMALSAVYLDIAGGGFEGGNRSIQVPGFGGEELSATVLGGTLILAMAFGGMAFVSSSNVGVFFRLVALVPFSFSVLAAFRIGSRTLLLVGILSIVISLIVNIRKRGLWRTGTILIVFSFFVVAANSFIGNNIEIFTYFQDRVGDDQFGIDTAGGRTVKWSNSLTLMFANPMGWGFSENGYSHNLWLDAARNGGWISFLVLCIATFLAVKTLLRALARHKHDNLFQTLVYCVGFSFLALLSVEPIFDGFVSVFSLFCCFLGMVAAFGVGKRVV